MLDWSHEVDEVLQKAMLFARIVPWIWTLPTPLGTTPMTDGVANAVGDSV
jgi:hypothetical protein